MKKENKTKETKKTQRIHMKRLVAAPAVFVLSPKNQKLWSKIVRQYCSWKSLWNQIHSD